jgi:hypothetical protein
MTVIDLPTPPGGFTAYGVTVYPLGDFDFYIARHEIVAFGRHGHRRFFAACQRFARDQWDWQNLADDRQATWAEVCQEISWSFAWFTEDKDEMFDPDMGWEVHYTQEPRPGTVPVTVWKAAS